MNTCKTLMAANALALLTLTQPAATSAQVKDPYVVCADMAEMIETIADAHQAGVPLSATLDVAARTIDPEGLDSVRVMIIEIYSGTRWHTEGNQARAVSDWRNAAHVECLRGLGVAG